MPQRVSQVSNIAQLNGGRLNTERAEQQLELVTAKYPGDTTL